MGDSNRYDVIIIGAGLTGLTLAHHLKKAGKNLLIVEKADKAGGVIQTHEKDGFVFESGPNTGVLGNPEIAELIEDLKDDCQLEIANPAAKFRWIWKQGKWHALPSGLISALKTRLFRKKDMIRLLGEVFRKKGSNPYESIAGMVKRRLGKSFLDYAVDPFISGVYAGDPEKLITKFALPKLYNLEQEYGSFIRGSIKLKKKVKTERDKKATSEVFSMKGGLHQLIQALTKSIGSDHIYTDCNAVVVEKATNGFKLTFKNKNGENRELNSSTLVSTLGGHAISNVFSFLSPEEKAPFLNMEYARVVQVVAGYNKWPGIELKAFGGLISSKENRNALGILFPSSIFENRAPKNGAVLSIFMGGRKKPEIFELSDEEIRQLATDELNETLKTGANKADMLEIFRYKYAIPQYERSTGERLEMIHTIETNNPGLFLAGNIRDGIGMADRVKQATDLAKLLTTY